MGPRWENQKGLKELVGTLGHHAQSQLISPGIICIVEVNLLVRLFFFKQTLCHKIKCYFILVTQQLSKKILEY